MNTGDPIVDEALLVVEQYLNGLTDEGRVEFLHNWFHWCHWCGHPLEEGDTCFCMDDE